MLLLVQYLRSGGPSAMRAAKEHRLVSLVVSVAGELARA